ncbi:hypothetical protein [Gordonia sputi]
MNDWSPKGMKTEGMETDGKGTVGMETGSTGQAGDAVGRRAPGLALLGIAAIAVAIWGLTDTPGLPSASVLGWGVVGIGLIVGLVLLVSGARRR